MAISINTMLGTLSLAIVAAVGFGSLRSWRQKRLFAKSDIHYGFRPGIGFTRLDGMASLALLLENNFSKPVWAEEIEISLAQLVADNQTSPAPLRGTQKIRQTVAPKDTVPISLAEVIYRAAGEPQRRHSSVLTSVLRYRVGEAWFEKQLDTCRIQMMGLTVVHVRRERNPALRNALPEKLKPVATIGPK